MEKNFNNLLFIDTETTGLEKEDRIFQVAYDFNGEEKKNFFKPELKISIEAMETTHYTNKDVENEAPFENSQMEKDLQEIFENEKNIFVAHNAKFDVKMLEKENLKVGRVIDTLKIAQFLDSDAKLGAYRLQYLRYALDLKIEKKVEAHDAMGDVIVLKALFVRLYEKMLKENSHEEVIEKMVEISENPMEIKKINFGKHKGKFVKDVASEDRGYLE
jgi:DNA polymerase-3 subunit epsilon/exodeoxyribonuclease X